MCHSCQTHYHHAKGHSACLSYQRGEELNHVCFLYTHFLGCGDKLDHPWMLPVIDFVIVFIYLLNLDFAWKPKYIVMCSENVQECV